ncbi:TIGR01244 family sulfur transferase [Pseudosulfitobacter koreensis]|uniref:TIGR01244 family sulfur transferase n=1 Tax=Pseudosulfitobacter koreensis TaxID=2968472 RepID=A0ABT1YY11_9RHOB|nr:TIGR01244 family sulfur transferase [Pseudosulfitobacter koreense]MCR8825765.1 TIGR01244 family sulfur transferase [Pseudosulfitobacter koreense]
MDIRQITPDYFVSPQIDPADMPAIAEAGFTCVICNRPDSEIPPSHHADVMAQAAEAAGLAFKVLPLTHQTMTPDNVAAQMGFAADAPGKVLAYCASGTRCTVIWALGQAGTQSVDDILATAQKGGYDLEGLRPTLTALSGA